MSKALKVKHKSLAAESRIIRKEEKKSLKSAAYYRRKQEAVEERKSLWEFNSLREHRIHVVRPISRITHIARAYIKGQPYSEVERPKSENALSLSEVKEIAKTASKYRKMPHGTLYHRVSEDNLAKELVEVQKWLVADR